MLRRALDAVGLLGAAREVRERAIAARAWRRNAAIRRAGAPDGWPLPPGLLVHRVAGTPDLGWYLDSGQRAAASIEECLRRHGAEIAGRTILDFGCGCGRLLRHWAKLPARLHGCDYDARQVAWCRRHLGFAEFRDNALQPPLPYTDASFQLIAALSVLTHLTEELQLAWMAELQRVLAPGGLLALSLHGRASLHKLSPEERAAFAAGRLVVQQPGQAGSNRCAAYHPERYVSDVLARGLLLLEHAPEGARGNPPQDLLLLRA